MWQRSLRDDGGWREAEMGGGGGLVGGGTGKEDLQLQKYHFDPQDSLQTLRSQGNISEC